MATISPLRYPGGKGCLAGFLEDAIDLNDLRGCDYYEPYAGGAGVALTLLKNKAVSQIVINDADYRVYAFWKSVLLCPQAFVREIFAIPLTIHEWRRQKEICEQPQLHSLFEVGFSTFYVNRCNRSGILLGAGPIGGISQKGKWKIDARFNRDNLAQKILDVAAMKDAIVVENSDAILFLKNILPKGKKRKRSFVYLDPPYVNKSSRIYLNAYKAKDHIDIEKYLSAQKNLPWVLSYDDTDLIRSLYHSYEIYHLPIRYSLQSKRIAKELIIAPDRVALPVGYRFVMTG